MFSITNMQKTGEMDLYIAPFSTKKIFLFFFSTWSNLIFSNQAVPPRPPFPSDI